MEVHSDATSEKAEEKADFWRGRREKGIDDSHIIPRFLGKQLQYRLRERRDETS
jgi:hypothetical protein